MVGAGFPIQGSRVQNLWVALRSIQSFIIPRLIKWVPGLSGKLVVKSKMPPRSGSSLEAIENHPKKATINLFKNLLKTYLRFKIRATIVPPPEYTEFITNLPFWATRWFEHNAEETHNCFTMKDPRYWFTGLVSSGISFTPWGEGTSLG